MIKRLFVSINIPDDLSLKLKEISDNITDKLKDSAHFKPSEDRYFHFTIKFLGSQEVGALPFIKKSIENAISKTDQSLEKSIKLRKIDYAVGNRMVWAFAKSAWMSAFAKNLEQELTSTNVSFDKKPFNGHITLIHIRDYFASKPKIIQKIDEKITITSVSLMESVLTPNGPIHNSLVEFKV